MAQKLAKVLAALKTVQDSGQGQFNKIYHDLQKPNLYFGLEKRYQPRDEDGDKLPDESTQIRLRAEDALAEAAKVMTPVFDTALVRDDANTRARADVKIGDQVILANVPATYLLWLEHRLVNLETVISAISVLDPAETWVKNEGDQDWHTPPILTTRTGRVPQVQVGYQATDKHPAQIRYYETDKIVGDWTTIKYSGALPAARKRQLLDRVVALKKAVHEAREEANTTEVSDVKAGEAFFGYLLAE
jgi:hypothetical protein